MLVEMRVGAPPVPERRVAPHAPRLGLAAHASARDAVVAPSVAAAEPRRCRVVRSRAYADCRGRRLEVARVPRPSCWEGAVRGGVGVGIVPW